VAERVLAPGDLDGVAALVQRLVQRIGDRPDLARVGGEQVQVRSMNSCASIAPPPASAT